jgi:outer membrane protein assembly factor BamA
MGNRRFSFKEILSWIKTRAGDSFKAAQIQEDLNTILATGFFDKSGTRVFIEDGARGGVAVYFEVHELPVIRDVSFEGLKIDQSVIRKAWQDAGINLQAGATYSAEAAKAAIRIIKQVLDSNGLRYSSVELRAVLLTSQTTNLVFVITSK